MHLLLLPLLLIASDADTFTCTGAYAKAGDLIVVSRNRERIEIRLSDIDCPGIHQPFGPQAKKQTRDLCFKKTLTVTLNGKDRYDRTLAFVTLPDGKQLNRELVRGGFAW